MKIKYNYLNQEFKNSTPIFKRWKQLIKSTDFTLGRYVKEFEEKFVKFVKSKYCIATNNGTDALILALKAINIKTGDEVIQYAILFTQLQGQ
jgi:dTDP-4-amino-4,6-dideoxygalactose transaminase